MQGKPRRAFAWMVAACTAQLALLAMTAQAQQPAEIPLPSRDAAATAAAAPASMSLDALQERAESLLNESHPDQSYRLLAPHEAEFGGNPRFDYLLGLAALDSGRAKEAVAALERVVAAQPEFSGGRMELGRALFESGDLPAARKQFQFLLGDNPPQITRTVIERYIAAIDQRGAVRGSQFGLAVEAAAGYDSNANGATANGEFLGFILNPRNVSTSSPFVEVAAIGAHNVSLGANAAVSSSLRLSHRANTDASFVDQSIANGSSTYLFKTRKFQGSIGINGYYALLDGRAHEHGVNLDVGLTKRFGGGDWEVSALARSGLVRFHDPSLKLLDVNRFIGGVALTRFNLGDHAGRVGAALIAGLDREARSNSPYGNHRYGARVFGGMTLAPRSSLYLEGAVLRSDYNTGSGFFGLDRRDKQYAAVAALEFQNLPRAGWSISPQVRYTRVDSNVQLFTYSRLEAMVWVKHVFH